MKKNKKNKQTDKKIEYLKKVRGIDRQLAIESGEFHLWMPKNRTHTDKKRKANKEACRKYKPNNDN